MNTKDYYRELDFIKIDSFVKRLARQFPVIRKINLHRDIDNRFILEITVSGDSEQQTEVRNALDSLVGLQGDLAELYIGEPNRDVFADWKTYVAGKYRARDVFELQESSEIVLFNASVPDPRAFVKGLVLRVTADGEIVFKPRRANGKTLNAQALGIRGRTKEWQLLLSVLEDNFVQCDTPAKEKMLRRIEGKLKTAISKNFDVDVSNVKLFEKLPGSKDIFRPIFKARQLETRTKNKGERLLAKLMDDFREGRIDPAEAQEQITDLLLDGKITEEEIKIAWGDLS